MQNVYCMSLFFLMGVCEYTCMGVCIYLCVYIYIYIYIYICICRDHSWKNAEETALAYRLSEGNWN